MSPWPEHVAELANEFEVNRRLNSAKARRFTQPDRLHKVNIRSTDSMGENSNIHNSSFGYGSSSHMTANLVEKEHYQPIYPPS